MSREDLENQQLGELSEELFEERGGFPGGGPKAEAFQSGKQMPPDWAYQNKALNSLQNAQLGQTQVLTRVTTIFDARPINAEDWTVVDKQRVENFTPP
jgi:hypothetical protein